MSKCTICNWFENHIKNETVSDRLDSLRLSKKIHKKSIDCPTVG